MKTFGETIRKYREDRKLPLRKVAAFLDIDQAILSKMERGQRRATREQAVKLAGFFEVDASGLLVQWLSDKLVYELQDEDVALQALTVAEEKVIYGRSQKSNAPLMIRIITDFFNLDGRIAKAWLFGSYARGEERNESDIDLMVSYSSKATGTLLDYADIKFNLEQLLNRKVDLVEEGFVKSFALKSIDHEKILIYG
jgi:predicted nucleotidyltransferase/plasmid maintenance system antidote protein VapI